MYSLVLRRDWHFVGEKFSYQDEENEAWTEDSRFLSGNNTVSVKFHRQGPTKE